MPNVDLSSIWLDISLNDMLPLERKAAAAHKKLDELTLQEGSMTGWVNFPETLDKTDLAEISATARHLRSISDAVVVIGAGGSYLGSRAVIELLYSSYYNELGIGPKLYFAGHNLSSRELDVFSSLLENIDFSVIVISKSGTTLEPALSLRFFRQLLAQRYGEDNTSHRIVAITDEKKGKLGPMADKLGWKRFTIPSNIGGRYSVFTAAGLLPMAVAGVGLQTLMFGAKSEARKLSSIRSLENPAWQYAIARNLLYSRGKKIELMTCYEPSFKYTAEWFKQLFGESEGKQGKGIFPASAQYTTDLHSLGQYVQEGERSLFETLVRFDHAGAPVRVANDLADSDGLNYLSNEEMYTIQTVAENAVISAHNSGGVPVVLIESGEINERNIGAMLYFFQLSCAISGLMLGVDPFDQPGVEAYKSTMHAMLKTL